MPSQEENISQTLDRLRKRIARLEKQNVKLDEEMTERGKEIVKFACIVRSCGGLIEEHVHDKLMLIVGGFEKRCYLTRRTCKRKTKL